MAKKETKEERQIRQRKEYLTQPHTPKQRKLPRNYQPPKEK